MARWPIPSTFDEAVEQFDGDRARAAWQLVLFEATGKLGHHVAHDPKTNEMVVCVNTFDEELNINFPAPGVPSERAIAPDAGKIAEILSSAVNRFGIPEGDRPEIAGARVYRYFAAPRAL